MFYQSPSKFSFSKDNFLLNSTQVNLKIRALNIKYFFPSKNLKLLLKFFLKIEYIKRNRLHKISAIICYQYKILDHVFLVWTYHEHLLF